MSRSRPSSARVSLAVALLAPWLSGGSCSVSYCAEDCDPCVQTCQCDTQCDRAVGVGDEEELRLEGVPVSVAIDGAGRTSSVHRILGPIPGSYLGRADASADAGPDALARFAAGVLRVNRELFGEVGEVRVVSVDSFGQAHVVVLEHARGERVFTVACLFDRAGRLVQIDEHGAWRPEDER